MTGVRAFGALRKQPYLIGAVGLPFYGQLHELVYGAGWKREPVGFGGYVLEP